MVLRPPHPSCCLWGLSDLNPKSRLHMTGKAASDGTNTDKHPVLCCCEGLKPGSCQSKTPSPCRKEKMRFILEPHLSDHGPGTLMWFTTNSVLQQEGTFMKFYSLTQRKCQVKVRLKSIGRYIREVMTARWRGRGCPIGLGCS